MVTLGFHFAVDGLDDETFVVREYRGEESLSGGERGACHGFLYQVELASRNSGLSEDDIVDKTAQLVIYKNKQPVQYVNGIVKNFTKGDIGHHHTFYSITLVPALERLSLRHNTRIFQQQSVKEIITVLLDEMAINNNVTWSESQSYAQREFCVQYRETDLEFMHRLLADEGIAYYFEHADGSHKLIFTDDTSKLSNDLGDIPYNALSGGVTDEAYITTFERTTQREVNKTVLKDYSFKKPAYGFEQNAEDKALSYQLTRYEHYDFPGRYKDDATGKRYASVRQQYLRRNAVTGHGKSNHEGIRPGYLFKLTDSLDTTITQKWRVIHATYQGTQPQALEEAGGHGATTYANQFTVIPQATLWRPKPQPKPQVDGPCMATVVGPDGEEIFCDKFGRVKVHFPWDRESRTNDQQKDDDFRALEEGSCWIRVAQGWAGGSYGMMAIPRIGHEVIVSFLNGDPDQPIITGRTYHATNNTPYVLPNHKTRTVLKTQTHQGDGYNEIRIEDQSSQEQIFIHAQKDKDQVIKNIHRESIGVDHHERIGKDDFQMVTENVHRTVGKNVVEEFGQDHHIKIGRRLIQRVMGAVNRYISGGVVTKIEGGEVTKMTASEEKDIGANQRVVVNNESYLKASKVILEATTSLTIKGPGGFVKIDSGGVTIQGNKTKINEGGSPDKGTKPTITDPETPDKPQAPDQPDTRG